MIQFSAAQLKLAHQNRKPVGFKVQTINQSSNAKLGPIPATISGKQSCAIDCPFAGNGCYAENFPLSLHWRRVTDGTKGTEWDEFCRWVETIQDGRLWRHDVAGDLPTDKVGSIDRLAMLALCLANGKSRGFTYTHHPLTLENVATLWVLNSSNFKINVSTESEAQAD